MGVPDFDGGWSMQPSMWRQSCVRQAAFALSMAHVINEVKREPVCPLAVREIWAYWDQSSGSPKAFKLHVAWGRRPKVGLPCETNWIDAKPDERDLMESKEFWSVCAHERDEGILAHPFIPLATIMANPNRRMSLLYRDTRVESIGDLSRRSSWLWRMRRKTLRDASGEVGDLLRTIGSAIAYAALPMPSQRLTLRELRDAREQGMGLAIEALMSCASHDKDEDSAWEYDFACREAGEEAVGKGNAVMCMAYLQGFFMALGDHEAWGHVAGAGEQEVYFGLLCRIEPKWGESLDAMARSRAS